MRSFTFLLSLLFAFLAFFNVAHAKIEAQQATEQTAATEQAQAAEAAEHWGGRRGYGNWGRPWGGFGGYGYYAPPMYAGYGYYPPYY